MKPDLLLAGAGKSGREGEDVKGGEEKTKAESRTEASAAHYPRATATGSFLLEELCAPRLPWPRPLTAFGEGSIHMDVLSHQ